MNITNKKMIFIMSLITTGAIMLYMLSGIEGEEIEDVSLVRNSPGGGSIEYNLQANYGDVEIEDINFIIPERKFTNEEYMKMAKEAQGIIVEKILATNDSPMNIEDNLDFVGEIKGYPFSIVYEVEDSEKIGELGEILTEKPFSTTITITELCGDFADSFSIQVRVNPSESVKARVYKDKIIDYIKESYESTEEIIELPKKIKNEDIVYYTQSKKRNPLILIIGFLACIALLIGQKHDERKNYEKRKEAILREYPVLLQKMALYLASGMTIRNIFYAVYEEGKCQKGIDNPMYQEMSIAINELQSGISEGMVYKRFGERTKVTEMVRFTALLSQNIKKGSSRLKELLNDESDKALTMKKQRAIRLGEEAGTKLLFPMMMLLVDVMILIMVPALWTM